MFLICSLHFKQFLFHPILCICLPSPFLPLSFTLSLHIFSPSYLNISRAFLFLLSAPRPFPLCFSIILCVCLSLYLCVSLVLCTYHSFPTLHPLPPLAHFCLPQISALLLFSLFVFSLLLFYLRPYLPFPFSPPIPTPLSPSLSPFTSSFFSREY